MGAEDAIRDLYAAIERGDVSAIGALLTPEVFVLPGSAAGALEGCEAVAAAMHGLCIRSTEMTSGTSDSGRSSWVFDQIEVGVPCGDSPSGPVTVRLTALLDDDGWRVRAAHWSIPLPSNAKQQELRAVGRLPDGAPLEESVPPEVSPLADRLRHAVTGDAPLPELYSVRGEAITMPENGDWKIVVSHDSVSNWPRLV